ncbi:hypothetical protein C8Q77DRAFT_1056753 [Trametes polyzona]|nr:hypothetical protein C8Q77DRAFT_1056753 [Trametes polyzona]
MEVLSRPKVLATPQEVYEDEPSPSPSMLVAPSTVTRSPPRLPSADHKLTIPARPPAITSRRHSNTVGTMSPSHLSRPIRSSPLAGPSIAATTEGSAVGSASAPSTPEGGLKHLSPLAEFSHTAVTESPQTTDRETKKQRRRSLGAVLSKLSFPASPGSSSEQASPVTASTSGRRRTKSTTSQEAPPVPPVPSWVHNTMPARIRSSHASLASAASSSLPSSSGTHSSTVSQKTSRPTSPTPSARSAASSIKDPRRASLRPPPSTSRSPEENWLTQSAAPKFSRLGLKAEGVILPVSAREARRRSTASFASTKARSFDTLPPPPVPARTPSRSSAASFSSLSASPPSPPTNGSRPSTAPAGQQYFRSRASSRASLASAASGSGMSVYCDTPSLTMSPGPSASDVSLNSSQAPTIADEFGVLSTSAPSPTRMVEFQLNDVPVGMLSVPIPAYQGKGKARADDIALDADSSVGSFPPWVHGAPSRAPSVISSAATSVVDLSTGGPALHTRSATAPELMGSAKEKSKRGHALGRMWKQVVRSVTTRR